MQEYNIEENVGDDWRLVNACEDKLVNEIPFC